MNYRQLLKDYLLHVYKWTGDFECGDDNFLNELYSSPILEIKEEILKELASKHPSESIISETIKVPDNVSRECFMQWPVGNREQFN